MHSECCSSLSVITDYEDAVRRDDELVAALRARSSDAFRELQRLYSHRLYKRILSITRNREDAEDALQDTFLRAFVAINSFEGRSQFSSWLTRIAINSALMTIRRRRTRSEVSFQQTSESGEENVSFDLRDRAMNPEEICDLKQRCSSMLKAIERLDPKSRTAIGIWATQESSMKEIAQTLDVSLATVKSRLHRARKRLVQFSRTRIGCGNPLHRIAEPSTPECRIENKYVRTADESELHLFARRFDAKRRVPPIARA